MSLSARHRVLFVDDDPSVLAGARRVMHDLRQQWEFLSAASGQEALSLLEQAPCDLIITDMQMPGMDGVELLSQVLSRFPSTVRFALSGYADRAILLKSVGLSHQFLAKPWPAESLKRAISHTLQFKKYLPGTHEQAMVSATETLPVLPDTFRAFQKALRVSRADVEGVATVVASDVCLAAKVLHLASWASLDFRESARNIRQAVGVLGTELLHSVLFSAHAFRAMDADTASLFPVSNWNQHATAVAALSVQIAREGGASAEGVQEAGTAGLLHDIGRRILMGGYPATYAGICAASCADETSITQTESEVLGVTHAELGAALMVLWGVPSHVADAVAFHHEPERCPGEDSIVLRAVCEAERLVAEEGDAGEGCTRAEVCVPAGGVS